MSLQDLERSLDYAKKVRADVDSAIRGIEYLIARERGDPRVEHDTKVKWKSYREMTDDDLASELQTLETKQSQATGWGAAVGVRGEYIDEIKREQRRRREVRAEDTFGGLRPKMVFTCYKCGLMIKEPSGGWVQDLGHPTSETHYHYACRPQSDERANDA